MTMEKTPEEIKAAVIEECKRLCTDGSQPKMFWGAIFMRDGRPNVVFKLFGSYGRAVDELDSNLIRLLYCLLGLEARDAVAHKEAEFEARIAMMDAKQGKYMDMYRTERARAAKLVELLEIAAADLKSCYHRLGLSGGNVLSLTESAITEWKGGQR